MSKIEMFSCTGDVNNEIYWELFYDMAEIAETSRLEIEARRPEINPEILKVHMKNALIDVNANKVLWVYKPLRWIRKKFQS